MTTRRHHRASGAVRKLPSGRWQAAATAAVNRILHT